MAEDNSSSPETLAEGHARVLPFPSDELLNLQDKMATLRANSHIPGHLLPTLRAAWAVVGSGNITRQADMELVRRFLKDDLQASVGKWLCIGPNSRYNPNPDVAFEVLHLVVLLGASMLEYRAAESPEVQQELDADLVPLMLTLLHVFDQNRPLHIRMEHEAVPADVLQHYDPAFAWQEGEEGEEGEDCGMWVEHVYEDEDELMQGEDDMQQDAREPIKAWYTQLTNTFGKLHGFTNIIKMLSNPTQIGFNLLNTAAAVLAQVVYETTPEGKQEFCKVVEPVVTHVEYLVSENLDRLADYGNDRTFTIFDYLVNINMHRILEGGLGKLDGREAEQQLWSQRLRAVLRTFITKMLDSSSFNKLLSGARECNKMLQVAFKRQHKSPGGEHVLEETCQWMRESNIVQRLLRTGLHHKQYMEQVRGVMVVLTDCGHLTAEHLDLMWAVTEKEDAYDAVKTHMFDLLAAVAGRCQPAQLDMLFAKLERSQSRSVQDTERLLSLLENLAESDLECKMVDKIINLIWEIIMPADAPPQLLDSLALIRVVESYSERVQDAKFVYNMVLRCFKAVHAGSAGQVPLLTNARRLFSIMPSEHKFGQSRQKGCGGISRQVACSSLQNQHHVVLNLTKSICSRAAALHSKAAAAAAAATSSDPQPPSLAECKEAALAELAEGSWSLHDILKECLQTIQLLACYYESVFEEDLAVQLWDALMLDASGDEEWYDAALDFFRGGFMEQQGSYAYFEHSTSRRLLEEHLVKQDVVTICEPSVELTWEVFAQVNSCKDAGINALRQINLKSGAELFVAVDLQRAVALDLLWRIYLSSQDRRVAELLWQKLLEMHCSTWVNPETPWRKMLVESVVRYLREATEKLASDGPADDRQLHERMAARCLLLANRAILNRTLSNNTMPPVPAHKHAWRGTPVTLELQREGSARMRLTTHDNEYIGLLRERVARAMGCSARHVRMFHMGQELQCDARTVQSHELRNRSTLNAMESPEPNKFTKAPAEFRPMYELSSMAWLLSQEEGLYPLLLRLIDAPFSTPDMVSMVLELLAVLPTQQALADSLAAALEDKQQQLATILDPANEASMQLDSADRDCAPYQTLYALQALCALLFPTFDEVLLASADRDAAAEGSACPSPAAAGTNGNAASAAEAQATAAEAAVVSAVQRQHQREVQQQEFLHSKGLEVVLAAAHKAAQCSSTDLRLRRQLSELLVVLLHNLLDAAHTWQSPPWAAAAAAPGNSNLPSAMSGAESGAGPAAGAAHAAPANSLVGATNGAAAARSASILMPDAPMEADAAAVSDGDAGESLGAAAAPSSKAAAATTSDTACHHPLSPLLEVNSPVPGQQQQPQQQQQPPGKQRQRDTDLPAQQLQQQLAAGNSSNPAAAQSPSLDALFSSHTLQLMADTLLSVAVDTSRLWGSDAAAAAAAMHSEEVIFKDIAVARDAMQLLLRLLEQHPPLVQTLLLDVEQPPLVSCVLLSPYFGALRGHAAELLERLVSNDAHRPRLLPWLVTKLAAARPLAQQWPASCTEFYQLLSGMLAKMGHSWGTLPEQLFATANAMLDEEVAALQAMAASGPPQGPLTPNSKLQQRRRRARRQPQQQQAAVGAALDDTEDDTEGQLEPPSCCLLQGRLQLVLALVRVLDRRAVGSEGQGGLMKLLLQEFLFPEAVAKAAAAADQLNLQHCTTSLEPHCATPNSRRAALELLAELMGDTAASLEEGVTMLLNLHYQHEVLERFSMLPKQLRSPGQYAGVKNGGATCYMNSVFQQLFMQPGIRARVLGSAEVPEPEKPDSVFAQLQGLFAQLALSKATFAQPYLFWASFKDYDGTPIDVREHQDAYEFFTRLQDFVDQHLISTNQQPAIKPIMGGTFVQQIICRGHDFTSERNEEFYQISVEVKGMGTLQRSLEDYVKGELMEGDNAYFCEELGKRVPAVKRTAIKTLPQMLCVHLKRFEFDYHNQTRHKLRDRFEFPLELDMFPYTAEGLAAADAQQSAAEQQQQQSSGGGAQPQQPRPLRSSSGSGAAWQAANGVHPDYMYDLYGVVVHSGSAFTGHYYSFIKERPGSSSGDQGPRWYCFDDKDVTLWDARQLETDCFGGKRSQDFDRTVKATRGEYERAHSAYMLFYERRAATAADANGNSALSSTQAQQQQQQQQGSVAAAAVDVEMVPGVSSSQPADAQQQAPAAAGAGSTLPSSLQPAGSGFAVPYGMPESLFRTVTANNVNLIWQLHVLDKHYFRFVRQLVDSRGDLGQLTTRKARRRDAAAAAAGAAGAAAAALAAVPSGSSDRVLSSMACDPSQSQQQQQPCHSTGSGGLPMQVSPIPTPAPSAVQHADAAAGRRAPAPPPLDVQAGPQQPLLSPGEVLQQSPGPSSRRGEEAEAVAAALMRLGTLFQFQVYLHAHDTLRSESNVWTEALKSLMGSGSSSSVCMQVFLELVQTHPHWLYKMLVNCDVVSQNSPRGWTCDMLSWVLASASKRCAHQLQAHVSMCLRNSITLGADLGQVPAAQVQIAEQHLRQQAMQPLGLAMLGLVDQLVALVRERLPRVSQQGQTVLGHEVPAEAVKVLLAFAESSPWAAAHLLQVVNIVPDLCEHIRAVVTDPTADELSQDELSPLYSLLYVTVRYASNLPQLTRELNQAADQQVPSPNPYLLQLPGSSSPSSSGSSGGGANGSEAAAAGVHAMLPVGAFQKLMQPEVLRGLVQVPVLLDCEQAALLAQLLTWGSLRAMSAVVPDSLRLLYNTCPFLQPEQGHLSMNEWELLTHRLCSMLLLADQWAEKRVCFFALGNFAPIGPLSPQEPGLLSNLQAPSGFMPTPTALFILGHTVLFLVREQQRQPQGQQHCKRMQRMLLLLGKVVFTNETSTQGAMQTYVTHFRQHPPELPRTLQILQYACQQYIASVAQGGQVHLPQQQQQQQQQGEELSEEGQEEEEEPAAAAGDAAEGDVQ